MWSNLLLHTLVARRYSLKSPDPLKSRATSVGLVRKHSPDRALEDLGGGTVMERASLGVHITALVEEPQELQLVAEIFIIPISFL